MSDQKYDQKQLKQMQLSEQEIENIKAYQPKEGHRFPVTRRELMAAGLVQGAAYMFMPTALTLLSREAHAQATGKLENPPAYIELQCEGGAAFMSNVAITDVNRNFLSSYNRCGVGSRSKALADVTQVFSNKVPMFKSGGLYRGLVSALGADSDILKQAAWLSLATSTSPDTSTNPMSACGLVQSVIAGGKLFSAAQYIPVNQSAGLCDPAEPNCCHEHAVHLRCRAAAYRRQLRFIFNFSARKLYEVFVARMNDSQLQRYANRPGGQTLASGVHAATPKVTSLLTSNSTNFDPKKDPIMAPIWGSSWNDGDDRIGALASLESAIVYALMKGYATSGGLRRVGYDYHGGSRESNTAADMQIGKLIGQILASFKAVGKPVYLYVTTDGSCSSDASDTGDNMFTGDSAVNAVNFVIAYRPGQTVQTQMVPGTNMMDTQVGEFESSQTVNLLNYVASARGSGATSFLNYLNFCGIDGVNSPAMSQTLMGADQLRQLSRIVRV